MYKLIIEQSYNIVVFDFPNVKDAVTFMEEVLKNCGKKTTLKLEYTQPGKAESEEDE